MKQQVLPERTIRLMEELQAVWAQINQGTAALQRRSGLACPPGCGKCCNAPTVESSMPELLPLACDLWRRGEAGDYIQFLEAQPDEKICLFYRPHPANREQGYCSAYSLRPSICRLFGFAGRISKHGRRQLNACEVHKHTQPELVAAANANGEMPLFEQFYMRIAGLEPELDWTLMPINQALPAALKKIGLLLSYPSPNDTSPPLAA
jgi:Fe-S-cluster containining protein